MESSDDIHKLDEKGNNILHIAALSGDLETVQRVIDKLRRAGLVNEQSKHLSTHSFDDQYLENKNHDGFTPLMLALRKNHLKVINTLVQSGAKVIAFNMRGNYIDNGVHPIYWAVENGRLDSLKLLLSAPKGSGMSVFDESYMIKMACYYEQVEILDFLLLSEISKYGINRIRSKRYFNHLYHCAQNGQTGVVRTLFKYYFVYVEGVREAASDSLVNIHNRPVNPGYEIEEILLNPKCSILYKKSLKYVSNNFELLADKGTLNFVDGNLSLIVNGSEFVSNNVATSTVQKVACLEIKNTIEKCDQHPEIFAAFMACLQSEVSTASTLQVFLDVGVDPSHVFNKGIRDGDSALMVCADNNFGSEDIEKIFHQKLKRLLDAGANVNHKDKNGCTLLQRAFQRKLLFVAELCIQYGADPNIKDNEGLTSLSRIQLNYLFHDSNILPLVELYVNYGGDLSHQNIVTKFHEFAIYLYTDVIALMLKAGFDAQANCTDLILKIIKRRLFRYNYEANCNVPKYDVEQFKEYLNEEMEREAHLIRLLAEYKAPIGNSAIHTAILGIKRPVIKALIDVGEIPLDLHLDYDTSYKPMSPLCVALSLNHFKLARDLMNANFLSACDIKCRIYRLCLEPSKNDQYVVNSCWSLSTLALASLSDLFGSGRERLRNIDSHPSLPPLVKKLLLFNGFPGSNDMK